jgi:hypothetical protein
MTRQRPKNRIDEKNRTPIRLELAIEIPEARDEVFSYLSHLENNPHWNWAVLATTPLDGPPRRGTRYIQHRTWPRPGSDLLEVTIYEPPSLLAVSGALDEGEVRYRYELTDMTPSRTRLNIMVDLESEITERGANLYTARLGAALSTNLETLRSILAGERLSSAASTG